MFNIAKLIKQLRYNEIDCIDLSNELVPDYSKTPEIISFKLNHDKYLCVEKGWFNFTTLQNNYFACTNGANIYICSADSKKCVSVLSCDSRISNLQCLPDGKLLSAKEHSIDLWDPLNEQYLGELAVESDSICCMAVLPINCIATGSNDHIIRMWHIDTKQLIMPLLFQHKWAIKFLASYQESYLVSIDVFNNIVIWYVDTLEKHKLFKLEMKCGTDIMSFVIDYSGNMLISSSEGLIYRLVPYYSPSLTNSILNEDIIFDLSDSIFTLKILPDGKLLALTSELKFYYLDQNKRRILNTFENKYLSWPHEFDILNDGRIVMSGRDEEISIMTFPLRKIMPEDILPLASALKDNHSINSIKLHVYQRNDHLLDQIYSNLNHRRDIKIIYISEHK